MFRLVYFSPFPRAGGVLPLPLRVCQVRVLDVADGFHEFWEFALHAEFHARWERDFDVWGAAARLLLIGTGLCEYWVFDFRPKLRQDGECAVHLRHCSLRFWVVVIGLFSFRQLALLADVLPLRLVVVRIRHDVVGESIVAAGYVESWEFRVAPLLRPDREFVGQGVADK